LTYPNPYQVSVFTAPNDLNWCATTAKAHIISIGQSAIRFYNTSSPTVSFSNTAVLCPNLLWAGSIAQSETFFHQRDPECNCPDKGSKPCPPGMYLTTTEGDVSDVMETFDGMFLMGREYLDSQNNRLTTSVANISLTVAYVSGNDSIVPASVQICSKGAYLAGGVNSSLIAGKVVVTDYDFDYVAQCGFDGYAFLAALNGSGVGAALIGLPPGSLPSFLVSPAYNTPLLFIQASMVDAVRTAWTRQARSPVPVPTSGGEMESTLSLLCWSLWLCLFAALSM